MSGRYRWLQRFAASAASASRSRPHNVVGTPLRALNAASAVPQEPAPRTVSFGFSAMDTAQLLSVAGAASPPIARRCCSANSASKLIGCSRNGGKPPSSTSEEITWRAYGNSRFGQ